MNATWGTRTRSRTECGYLVLGAVTLTAAIVFYLVSHLTPLTLATETYVLLATFYIVGVCGWITRSSDTQRRRDLYTGKEELVRGLIALTAKVDRLSAQLAEVQEQVRHRGGQTYISQAAAPRSPVDATTVPGQTRVVQRNEVDEVRAQAYAEGYVDGIARRQDGS
ncbi:hypothetical protein EYA84_01910 [Verrucosispora sp. SN26_14.1]|uniref:hypothetical protein n=1 Tax=Verrucosispora sp. SN26_14.1 TaxID=2527879 RepID=UPI0010338AD1|nr:hypothetical protein [Verrucosispora sp. SN26_14.1]TBL44220.1 hypothetical protein EYA84_01910 [Verrucosispora sp. SN26_14.1]